MADASCVHCGGSGWVVVEKGGLSAAKRCDCDVAEAAGKLESKAAIPPLYQAASLDNFLTPPDGPSRTAMNQVLNIVRTFAREYPMSDKPGLLFIGSPGIGKTHLAVAVLRRLLDRGFDGTFFDYQNLLDNIRRGYDPNSGQASREAYQTAMETGVLLLDDLGAHRVTDWVEDTITSIITYRCNNRLPLIATTNLPDPDAGFNLVERDSLSPSGIMYKASLSDRIGSRARSRLFEMCRVIKMPEVGDYRLRKSARTLS